VRAGNCGSLSRSRGRCGLRRPNGRAAVAVQLRRHRSTPGVSLTGWRTSTAPRPNSPEFKRRRAGVRPAKRCVSDPGPDMNAQLLKKLFRAIGEGKEPALNKVALEIVKDERRRGHERLAGELEKVLGEGRRSALHGRRDDSVQELRPLSAARELLVSLTSPDKLAHHMVLASEVEARFQRIENEFAARERLAV